jgi:2-aminoadipate transaminase
LKGRINFLRGVPADEALEPVAEAFADSCARVMRDYGGRVIQYQTPGLTDFNGFVPLKEVLLERLGGGGDPQERVLCSNGGMETFSLLLKSLPRGRRIAVEALTYDRVLADIDRQGHEAVGIPLGDEGVDLDALRDRVGEGGIDLFYQVACHQSPTGLTVTAENMEAAAAICDQAGALHVLDLAYFELRYDGRSNRLPNLERFSDTTCLLGSFTKTLSPGAKCGFGVLPPRILRDLTPVVANTRLNPNYPTQAAIHGLIESGFYDRHLAYLRDLYRPRMEAMNRAVENHLPTVSAPRLTGGFFLGIRLPGVTDERDFVDRAEKRGVLLAPAKVFAPGWRDRDSDRHGGVFFRLTFPAHPPEETEVGVARIAETYREFLRT